MIDRFARSVGRCLRPFVKQVAVVRTYLGEFPTSRPDLGKPAGAPEALIAGTHELKFAMLVGEPVVQGESHKLEIWRTRAHAEHVLRQILICDRLFLFLHIVTKPPQVSATESRNPILHEPLLAKVRDPWISAEPFPQGNVEIDVIDLGNVSRFSSLSRDGASGYGRRLLSRLSFSR